MKIAQQKTRHCPHSLILYMYAFSLPTLCVSSLGTPGLPSLGTSLEPLLSLHIATRGLPASHLDIPLSRDDSRLLAPEKQRHGHQQKDKAQHGDEDMKILNPHSVDPRSEREEDDDGEGVAREDDADQRISDYLV